MQPTWTVYPFSKGEKTNIWHPARTFATKREAVALFSGRKTKTPIVRDGHTYYIEVEK